NLTRVGERVLLENEAAVGDPRPYPHAATRACADRRGAHAREYSCGTRPGAARQLTLRALLFLRVRDQWGAMVLDHVLIDDHLRHRLAWRVEHDVEQRGLEDRAQATRAALLQRRHVRDLHQRTFAELELDAVHREQLLVLLDERVLGLRQD